MRIKLLPYSFMLLLAILFSLTSCIKEYYDVEEGNEEIVQLELFTRAYDYSTPVETRSGSADEYAVDRSPYIIVFAKNESDNYMFVEAVRSYYIDAIGKTYIILKRQRVECQLLILANPQANFYAGSTLYTFNEANLTTALTGRTIAEACSLLYSERLTGSQADVPFSNDQKLPMSFVHPVSDISAATTIGTGAATLKLIRGVAKVVVVNEATNFILKGVTAVINAPRQGQLHNLTPASVVDEPNVVDYKTDDNYSNDIALAMDYSGWQATRDNPVYLFETNKNNANRVYLIIRGEYQGVDCYYKMAVVDNNRAYIDLLRDCEYKFTINRVVGEGHKTAAEAIAATAFNNLLGDVELTVTDTSAYETTAFDSYYLSVSNSHYIAYSATVSNQTAFQMVTYSADGAVTGTITDVPAGVTVSPTSFTATSTAALSPVTVTMPSTFTSGKMVVKLGNIKKVINLEKRTAWGNGAIKATNKTGNFASLYCVSGYVDPANSATTWIKLHPSGWASATDDRNDMDHILVSDGIIQIERRAAGLGVGTIYLSTTRNPGSGNVGEDASRRIKVDIIN